MLTGQETLTTQTNDLADDHAPQPLGDLAVASNVVDLSKAGVCQGLTHVFFGPPAERPERRHERETIAAAYCDSCPVTVQCRTAARQNREHGFWGGENDEQRAAAGFAPRSPSRRAVVQARDRAKVQASDQAVA